MNKENLKITSLDKATLEKVSLVSTELAEVVSRVHADIDVEDPNPRDLIVDYPLTNDSGIVFKLDKSFGFANKAPEIIDIARAIQREVDRRVKANECVLPRGIRMLIHVSEGDTDNTLKVKIRFRKRKDG